MAKNQRPVEEYISLRVLADDVGWSPAAVAISVRGDGYRVSSVELKGKQVQVVALRDGQNWREKIVQTRAAQWRQEVGKPYLAADTAMSVIYGVLGSEPDRNAALEFIAEAYENMISVVKQTVGDGSGDDL